jgi:nucleoside-diphosphate-sugar epimerase
VLTRAAQDIGRMTRRLLSLGHGYSAQALSDLLIPQGWGVTGTTRRAEKAARLADQGIEALIWPGTDLAPALERATHILVSAAPDAAGDPVLAACGAALTKLAPKLEWLGYLSTTGVYGDHQGGWVDEQTPLTPSTQRGRWRVQAEDDWRALAGSSGLPLHIFRLAGIYGPGRGPFKKLRSGTARCILKPNQFMSRIHVEDIGRVLEASIAQPLPGGIYNVCDDEPCPPEDVLRHAAGLLDLPPPPDVSFDQAEMTPMARSFYAESKKVRNARIKTELGVALAYPTYREGLAALLGAEA